MALTKVTGEFIDIGDIDISDVGTISLDAIQGDADANTSITFSGSDVITIATGGSGRLTIGDGALSPVTDNQIDLGTSSLEFKDGYFDGTVTADAFAGPLTGDVTGNVSGTAATVTTAAQTNITSLGSLTALTGSAAPFVISNTSNGNNIDIKTTSSNSLVHAIKIHSGGVFEAKQGAVFNEDSNDVDFRVESNGNANMLFVDGGNDRVGIGTSSPSAMLHLYKATGSGALEPELIIENNHNTSSVTDGAGRLTFYSDDSNNSGIPDLAWLGQVRFMGDDKDGSATEFEYAYMVGLARDPGSGTGRKGGLSFYTRDGNSMTETMTITESRVGIGTTSPARNLVVSSSGQTDLSILAGTSASAQLQFGDSGDDNIGQIEYNNSTNDMKFSTNATERMCILGEGAVIINGTTAEVAGSCTWSIGSRNPVQCFNASAYVQNSEFMTFRNQGTQIGSIVMSNTNATTYGTSSDYRLKENVSDMTGATAKLKQLKPKRFNWIADTTNTLQDGFLAHEVSPVVPEAIIGDKDAKDSDDNPIYQQIDHSKLVPLLVKTIQELEARIATLEE